MSAPRPRPRPSPSPKPAASAPSKPTKPTKQGIRARFRADLEADRAQRRRSGYLSPGNWVGAMTIMLGITAVLYVVQIVNSQYSLVRFGLRPRHAIGLRGVVTEPFIHLNWDHLLSNTLPFLLIGWGVMLAGIRTWGIVTGVVVIGGGLLTWAVAPSDQVIVGASGLVFGWLGFLVARALFSRELKWIFVAVVVLVFFGSLLLGVLPRDNSNISWQAHACGFVAGILAASLLHHPQGGPGVLGRGGKRSVQ